MASPFAVFRRNQKVLLAIVAISAMVAFVFLDPLMKYIGPSQKVENPVVVETKYGALTHSQLDQLLQQRQIVERFLRMATSQTVLAQIAEQAIGIPSSLPPQPLHPSGIGMSLAPLATAILTAISEAWAPCITPPTTSVRASNRPTRRRTGSDMADTIAIHYGKS